MAQKSHLQSTSRTATWRVLSPYNGMTSEEFVIGKWTWCLKVEQSLFTIYPKRKNSGLNSGKNPVSSPVFNSGVNSGLNSGLDCLPSPTASLNDINVCCSKGEPKADAYFLPGIIDMKLKYDVGVSWDIKHLLIYNSPITIRVEFIDLKMPLEDGNVDKVYSIWAKGSVEAKTLAFLRRMLFGKIQTDVIINTSNGSIEAHRAILAANSPVFQAMFSNSYKEEASATIDISDMTLQTCEAMLYFIYAKAENEEFRAHRMELITAADKYDLVDLKEACELSLIEDIGPENVLDRLLCAFKYELHELKSRCLSYLVNFGMIHEVRDDLNTFFLEADRELIAKVVLAIFDSQKSA